MDAHDAGDTPITNPPDPLAEFAQWRETLLNAILVTLMVLGGLVAIPGIYLAWTTQVWPIAVADVLALLWLICLWAGKTLPWALRVWGFLALPMALGGVFLSYVGTHGLTFLSCVPVMSALLLGWRSALAALLLSTATLLAIGPELGTTAYSRPDIANPTASWIMLVLNFLFIGAVVAMSTVMLLRKLAWSIQRAHEAQAGLQRMALFDGLTGLPNRRHFSDQLSLALRRAQRRGHRGALLFIDIDHFKNVNDTRGHNVGDAYLKAVSERLSRQLRACDMLARLGGDEFVVLLTELPTALDEASGEAMHTAERLRNAMETPINLGQGPFQSTISTGVALFPQPGQSAEDLLREADTAMYRAKEEGRNRIAFFEPAMQSDLQERLVLERDLAQAIAAHELAIAVQAQVDAGGRTVGAAPSRRPSSSPWPSAAARSWPWANGSWCKPACSPAA
jgi:diguanylate cyclase (GGDEF)-like protein